MHFIKAHRFISAILLLAVLYIVLLIPESPPAISPVDRSPMKRPFIWNQDARWDSLEASFAAARSAGTGEVQEQLENRLLNLEVIQVCQDLFRAFNRQNGRLNLYTL